MPQPPTTPVLARELVRFLPFAAQKTFVNAALADSASLAAEFDVARPVTDRNQLLGGAFPGGGGQPPQAVGPYLDALVYATGAGQLLVEYAVDRGCLYRQIALSVVPATTAVNISGLRITGRFVRCTFTNKSGAPVAVEFGVYIRST